MKGFRFSDTRDCPVVYYNNPSGIYVTKDETVKRVGQKETGGSRTMCYCLNVPEERILREIVEEGCCTSMEDVREYTRANTGKACQVTNPKGACCEEEILGVIQKGLALAGRTGIEQPHVSAEPCCQLSTRARTT